MRGKKQQMKLKYIANTIHRSYHFLHFSSFLHIPFQVRKKIGNILPSARLVDTELWKSPCYQHPREDEPVVPKKLHGSYGKSTNRSSRVRVELLGTGWSHHRMLTDAHAATKKTKGWISSGCGPSATLPLSHFKFWLIFYGFWLQNPSCSNYFYIYWMNSY